MRPKLTTAPQFLKLAASGVFLMAISACSTGPTTCAELKTAADLQHCPERLVETTVTTFEPLDIGEIPEPPPITAATVPDAAPVATALQALAADLKAARAWGWTLYHMLQALERAEGKTNHE